MGFICVSQALFGRLLNEYVRNLWYYIKLILTCDNKTNALPMLLKVFSLFVSPHNGPKTVSSQPFGFIWFQNPANRSTGSTMKQSNMIKAVTLHFSYPCGCVQFFSSEQIDQIYSMRKSQINDIELLQWTNNDEWCSDGLFGITKEPPLSPRMWYTNNRTS